MDLLRVNTSESALATLILAHGAGASMDSEFMHVLCQALAEQRVSTVRFEFPYMAGRRHGGGKRPPDRQPVLLRAWREVFAEVTRGEPQGKILIGGKSMGGRMASLIAEELQPAGFCCFGYPFHPPGKPDNLRTEHFLTTTVPGLILQGTRDPFGKPAEIDCSRWRDNIRVIWLEEADHDFSARKKSGLTRQQIILQAAVYLSEWLWRLSDPGKRPPGGNRPD